MQIAMFLTLGHQVFPTQLVPVAGTGLLLAGVPQAGMIFNLVFFSVLMSVLLQGTSIPLVARWLRVDEPLQSRVDTSPVWDAPSSLKSGLSEVTIPDASTAAGKRLLDLGLPKRTFVILAGRNGLCFVPDGSTVLEAGDSLLVFTDLASSLKLRSLLEVRHPHAVPCRPTGREASSPPDRDGERPGEKSAPILRAQFLVPTAARCSSNQRDRFCRLSNSSVFSPRQRHPICFKRFPLPDPPPSCPA